MQIFYYDYEIIFCYVKAMTKIWFKAICSLSNVVSSEKRLCILSYPHLPFEYLFALCDLLFMISDGL